MHLGFRALRVLWLAVAWAAWGSVLAQGPPGYYDGAIGLSGEELHSALHDIIDGHSVLPHSQTHAAIDLLQEDPDNPLNVILVYSGFSVPKSSWPGYNREHLWPVSLGASDGTTPHTDVFNIYGCDANVNGTRGNKYFDVCTSGCSTHPEAPACLYDFDSWEPRDCEKGDLARALFYMDVRYAGDVPGEPDLVLGDLPTASGCDCMALLQVLIEWSLQDPPDEAEELRNNMIFAQLQGNRNPFIDHPEWVAAIWAEKTPSLVRGDCAGDSQIQINDAIALLHYLFASGSVPCLDACDVDDDGLLQINDPILILQYLFNDGAPPAAPFPGCGSDDSPDGGEGDLGCETFAPCP